MKKILLLLFPFILGLNTVNAQNYRWSNTFGGASGNDEVRFSYVDAAGNLYVCGFFSDTADFNPGAGTANFIATGSMDAFIAKYDAAGNYLWAKTFGGTGTLGNYGYAMQGDDSGNIYVTGFFISTVDFNPANPGINVATSKGQADIFIIKYDTAGNFKWVKTIGSTLNDIGYGLVTDHSGDIYICGTFSSSPDFNPGSGTNILTSVGGYDMFVAKYDGDGNYVWARGFGSAATENFWNMDIDNAGNIYLIGYFQNTVNFNAGKTPAANLTASGNLDIVMARYDTAGNYIWAKKIGATAGDFGRCIKTDHAGHLYATGYFSSTVDFNPGSAANNLASSGLTDIFLAKYDTSGNYIWAEKIGGTGNDNGWQLALDQLDGVYLTGYFSSATVDFNPGAGTANLANPGGGTTSAATTDGFLAKYDTAGNYQWAHRIGSTDKVSDYGYAISIRNKDIYAGGTFSDTVDFDFNVPVAKQASNGSRDLYMARYDQCQLPDSPALTASNTVICKGDTTVITIVNSNLNDATGWQWYSGSCGGTPVGTGDSLSLLPADTTTYYVRGEGGCVSGGGACGSITINVIAPVTVSQSVSICQSDSIFLGGAWQQVSGTYRDTLVSASGCDSILSTTLSVVNIISVDQSFSICTGDSMLLGGQWRKTSGIYYDTFQSMAGCDSIMVSHLAIVPTYNTAVNTAICEGDSILIGGIWRMHAGTYKSTYQSTDKCDSIVTTHLSLNPTYKHTEKLTICYGDSAFLGGAWQTKPGSYTDVYASVQGCDSTIVTDLSIRPLNLTEVHQSICEGDSLFLQGAWQTDSGTYRDTFATALGCDSIIVAHLMILPAYVTEQELSICKGDSIFLNGKWETTAGTYYDTLRSVSDCDSVIITKLSIQTVNLSISINGQTLTSNTNGATYQWVDCNKDYAFIPGATGQSYTASSGGDIAVIVTKDGCTDTSVCYHIVPSGIAPVVKGSLDAAIYPNPAHNVIHIDLQQESSRVSIKVRDLTGRTVMEKEYGHTSQIKLNLDLLTPGLYIAHIVAGNKEGIFKITKK